MYSTSNPNIFHFFPDSANPIKNQLQAELCSTLNRRQNNGNKKPNFIVPKNTTINAINNQLRELQNQQNQTTPNGKPTSTIDAPSTKHSTTTTDAKDKEEKPKLMLSHGKPNFKIASNSTNSKKLVEKDASPPGNELIGTLRRRLKSVECLDEMESTTGKANEVEKSAWEAEPQKIKPLPAKIETKVPASPPLFYKASVKNFNSTANNTESTDGHNEIKRTIRRLKSTEMLEHIEKSSDEKTELNDIQRRIQNLKTVEINKLHSSPNGYSAETRTEEHRKVETISVRSATTETDCFQSSPILPRRAQLFKHQQQNLTNSKITAAPIVHHVTNGNANYSVKPVTSFSRDLQLTPNRYPDKILVTKTAASEPEPVFFSDIKFVINSKGEVVRS